MRNFLSLLNRFRKDEGGAFAVIFGVLAIVLIAMSGAAVDFTVIQQARTRAQVALDAAALALQPTIYTATTATIQSQAQALLANRLADRETTWATCTSASAGTPPCAYVATPTVDTTNGVLTLKATLRIPTYFVSMVGVPMVQSQIVSVATRKKLALEVSMVLDNSGSMCYQMGSSGPNCGSPSRMSTLQSSAVCAVNIIYYGVTTCSASTAGLTANTNVKIGIVPFTQEVNVGSSNSSASWLDRGNAASITLNNFDNNDISTDTFSSAVDRVALFGGIKYTSGGSSTTLSWGGCVEARKNPYDTDDTAPTTGDTLYTPFFAVDEPGAAASSAGKQASVHGNNYYNSYLSDTPSQCKGDPTVVWSEVKTKCNKINNQNNINASNWGNLSCSGGTTTDTYQETDQNGTVTNPTSIPATIYNNPQPTDYQESYSSSGSSSPNYTYTRTRTYYYLSDRVLQERMCKYGSSSSQVSMSTAPVSGSVFGPNGDCPSASVLPLTSTPGTVTTAINNMVANGGTNITEGSVWGWHVLSPNSPFSSKGAAYDQATSKVMIIMTDGENTTYPSGWQNITNINDATYYSAYAFPWNQRLGQDSTDQTTLETVMNTRLSTVCTNAKTAGVTIYTIGVDVADTSNPTNNTTLLTNCATKASYAYFPNTASDLQATFVAIASQLSALRLSQ